MWMKSRRLLFCLILIGAASASGLDFARQAKPPSGCPVSISSWSTETSLPQARQEVSVTALNGQVYVVGGSTAPNRINDVSVFDPASHAWSSRAPYPGPGRDHMGIASLNGYLYLLGGLTNWPGPALTTFQRYNPNTDSWSDLAPLPLPRGALGVAVLNRRIYVAGGLREGAAVSDFTVYDPATDSWQTLPPMPTARDHLVGVALNGKFYAIGGRNGSQAICSPVAIVEVYDPATNSWSTAAPMSTARGGQAAVTLNGRIQVFGGEGGAGCGVIASAEEYDPASNSWRALPSMPTPRHGTGGATIGQSIYLPGGATNSGDAPTAVQERFTELSGQRFAANGGTGSFGVTAADGCAWTAIPGDSWMMISGSGNGAGKGTVNYSVARNSNSGPRRGTITISGQSFAVSQGAQFLDVPAGASFYTEIGQLSAQGITVGCGGGNYCPAAPVTREQMAIFIERALGVFTPPTPPPRQQTFADVGPSRDGYAFIEDFARRGITTGCGGGNYCPDSPVTREQMAAFMLKALGVFTPPAPVSQRFSDVGPDNPFYSLIDQMALRGITAGCGGKNYCPTDPVKRAEMAAFLIRAFG